MANIDEVRFAYGLIFFTLGLAIMLQPRRQSVYFLASALTWLAGFAFIHAFADWGLVLIPEAEKTAPGVIEALLHMRALGVIVSFGLLMQFGITLLTENYPGRRWLSLIPTGLTAVLVLLLLMGIYAPGLLPAWLTDAKVMARYFLGFPAALLSGRGLVTQAGALRRDRLSKHMVYLYRAAICFGLYGIVGGLIVPARTYFPASHLNEELFFRLTGLPVEVVRGVAIAGLTYYVVKLLDIFHLETQRRLQAVERDRALLRERELIARELHDGIMQTLYGTGLGVKQVMNMACIQNGSQAQEILGQINQEIARSIVQMRSFVLDLKEAVISGQELALAVEGMASDIGQIAGLAIQTDVDGDLEQVRIPGGLREEVLAVVREGLSNVVRHANAQEVRVLLSIEDGTVLVRVADDGQGVEDDFAPSHGLSTLRDRVEALGGYMQILGEVGKGTQLVAHLPVRSKLIKQEEKSA